MSDLETQTDLRSTLEAAFEAPAADMVVAAAVDAPDATVADKPIVARDESGKFASKAPADTVAPVTPAETPAVDVVAPVVKKAPSSWKKETQAEWDKLPAHVQDDVLRREGDFHKGIETYKQAATRAQAYEAAIQPFQATIQKLGVAPEVAITALFKADDILRNSAPQEKAAYFAQLAQAYGISIENIQAAPAVDPQYQSVLNELHSLKQEQETRQQQEQTRLNNQIAAFAEGKEHFNAVSSAMAALIQAGQASDMETAYDMAIWARPDLRAGLLEQQTRSAEEKARAALQKSKAQSAAVSVRGSSPTSGASSTPSNLRSALEAAFNT
jgi:hypothetical protein